MSWNPVTWTAAVVTVARMNAEVRDRFLSFLGPFAFYVDATALRPDLTNGCDFATDQTTTGGRPLLIGCGFSGSADQFAQFKWALPKGWNAGTVTFRPRWSCPTAGAGDVVWSLAAVACSDGDTIDVAFGTAQTSTDTFQSANKEHLGPTSSAITIAGTPAKQDTIYFRVGRLATAGGDTKAEKVYLLGIEVFATMDDVNDA